MNNHDLDWLAEQQPQRRGTDKEAHDRALLSLLRHASSRAGDGHRSRGRRLNIAGLLNPRLLAVATGTGAAAAAAAIVLSAGSGGAKPQVTGSDNGGHAGTLQAAVRHHATKSPLIRLADDVGASTQPAGDATLIQRSTILAGKPPITVYDLYTDNGEYFFSQNESGLPAQVSGDNNQGGGQFAREVAAAKEATTGSVAQAAIDMANAPDPNRSPVTPSNSVPTPQQTAAAKIKEKILGVPPSPGTLFDNWAWEDSEDAIIAGAGDPQVRAGVLQILATLPGVTVTNGTSDGQPTLILTGGADEVGSGYQEQLTINAETGMPVQFVGSKSDGSAATTVDYQVKRVTLSDIAGGTVPSF